MRQREIQNVDEAHFGWLSRTGRKIHASANQVYSLCGVKVGEYASELWSDMSGWPKERICKRCEKILLEETGNRRGA